MAKISKALTDEEKKQVRLNPPYILNTHQAAAFLTKSVRTVREMFQEEGFPLMRGSAVNSEMSVLRDDLIVWMKGNGSLVR